MSWPPSTRARWSPPATASTTTACAAVEDVLVERLVGMDPARITTVARKVATRIAADQVAAATAKNRKDRPCRSPPARTAPPTGGPAYPPARSAAAWAAVRDLGRPVRQQRPRPDPGPGPRRRAHRPAADQRHRHHQSHPRHPGHHRPRRPSTPATPPRRTRQRRDPTSGETEARRRRGADRRTAPAPTGTPTAAGPVTPRPPAGAVRHQRPGGEVGAAGGRHRRPRPGREVLPVRGPAVRVRDPRHRLHRRRHRRSPADRGPHRHRPRPARRPHRHPDRIRHHRLPTLQGSHRLRHHPRRHLPDVGLHPPRHHTATSTTPDPGPPAPPPRPTSAASADATTASNNAAAGPTSSPPTAPPPGPHHQAHNAPPNPTTPPLPPPPPPKPTPASTAPQRTAVLTTITRHPSEPRREVPRCRFRGAGARCSTPPGPPATWAALVRPPTRR